VIVYLSSPGSQMHASHLGGMPVLLSFAAYTDGKTARETWVEKYAPSFARILIDSGAFSELNTGKKVDLSAYADWAARWGDMADAVAGLDDISGDWRRSLANYEAFPAGFPTFHETDPPELLDDLIPLARSRGNWLGLGLLPPRDGKERWVREACERLPPDLHVHGWALRGYTRVARLDSTDSTNWFRDAWQILNDPKTKHLTPSEAVEIVVKRYARWHRIVRGGDGQGDTPLFEGIPPCLTE
jgi:hypothetical protein